MGVDIANGNDRTPEEHAVAVLRRMHAQLIGVVQEAMRDSGNPDGVLAAIDGAMREQAVAARRAVDAERAEGDLESARVPGVILVVTKQGKEDLMRIGDLGGGSFQSVDGGFRVEFQQGAYMVGSPAARERKVAIFRRARFGNGGQQMEDSVRLPIGMVVRIESAGGQTWKNVEMAGENGTNGAALRPGDKAGGADNMPEVVKLALLIGAEQRSAEEEVVN